MTRSSDSARDFIRQLADLTERLAKKNIVVAQLSTDWSGFGSWQLSAQIGKEADDYSNAILKGKLDTLEPKVVSFSWDGRDQNLNVKTASTPPLSGPIGWEQK